MGFLTTGFNLLLIVVGFGVLIFVHELGHFLAAKWAGIRTEAFAVGMGPVALAWRKGVGVVLGSTHAKVVAATGKAAHELDDAEMERHGIGETEYSLRWLPIGGFVKMLGQEDANPTAVSDDPRSYGRCPIGRRMVVVSAGVIMNLILAAILFIVAFMIGVRFEAPVVGDVVASLPAGRVAATNAAPLGISTPGLLPGDVITHVDGDAAKTFADVQIASAMSKPGVPIGLTVRREGVSEPLEFVFQPEKDRLSGLLSIGVAPGSSTTLSDSTAPAFLALLETLGLTAAGIEPGMRMLSAAGQPVKTYEQFLGRVKTSDGAPIPSRWSAIDEQGEPVGAVVETELPVRPLLAVHRYPDSAGETVLDYELGLLGMSPLVRIADVSHRQNRGILEAGDLVLRAGAVDGPRMDEFRQELLGHARGKIDMVVLRDGAPVEVAARVNAKGLLSIGVGLATDLPLIATPMERVRLDDNGESIEAETGVAPLMLLSRTRIDAVDATPVADWAELRAALRSVTAAAQRAGRGATLELSVTHPTPGREQTVLDLALTAAQVEALHELSWSSDLASNFFEPIYTTRSADGNPVRAVVMGVEETHKLIVMTYLTIDRLIRGSVGVDQLRGPVGIVHLGTRIADRGFTYLIFFLAMISVNLAVLNFLPLPIVDGGLFLFLIYEKFKGQPPPLAFQNAATIAGLFLIGTAFVVTFYNDVMRLIG